MARIRTIKPEFWTDEKVVQLPFHARLVFIGMWNFADDHGYLHDEPERLRLQILPNDQIDIELVIDMLCVSGLVERVDFEGADALWLPKFAQHQKISHKTPTKFPVSSGKKRIIPSETRRKVALKYGCKPGGEADATCYHCGAPGRIWWHSLNNGRPGAWVAFSGLELDHLQPEARGGTEYPSNIVLSCRACNSSRCSRSSKEFLIRKHVGHFSVSEDVYPESAGSHADKSGSFAPEGNGMEGKGKEEAAAAARDRSDLKKAFEAECREAVAPEPVMLAQDFHALEALIDEGVVTEIDIRTGIREALEKRSDGRKRYRTWSQFAGWCRTAAQNRLAGGPRARPRPPPPPVDENPDDPIIDFPGGFRRRKSFVVEAVTAWRKDPRSWPVAELSAPPDSPGCRVPRHLLDMVPA